MGFASPLQAAWQLVGADEFNGNDLDTELWSLRSDGNVQNNDP